MREPDMPEYFVNYLINAEAEGKTKGRNPKLVRITKRAAMELKKQCESTTAPVEFQTVIGIPFVIDNSIEDHPGFEIEWDDEMSQNTTKEGE
jgi:hypothetical protein